MSSALQALVMPTRQEPGCLDYQLFELTDEPGTFYMRESFTDELAMEAHRATPHFQAFAAQMDGWLAEPMRLVRLTAIN
ncbi:Quinol monooxygenase YgiN [Roseateles sp. YR242]|nr:Quinol monooxygenase YgiN [Roseateles sp. YR242]